MTVFGPRPLPRPTRQLSLLLKVRIRALLASFGLMRGSAGGSRVGLMAGAIAMTLCVSLTIAGYLFGLGFVLWRLGMADVIPAAAVLAGALPALAMTFAKAHGALFGFRDYDLTMSMPLSVRMVVLSRVVPLYLVELASSAVAMTPLLFVYALVVPMTPLRLALAVASVALTPMAPTGIAVVLSFLVAALSSRLRHAKAIALVLGTLFLAGGLFSYLWLSLSLSSFGPGQTESVMRALANLLRLLSERLWPLASWASWLSSAMEGNLTSAALFVGASLAVPAACLELLTRFFMPMNAALLSHGTRHDSKPSIRRVRSSANPLRALLAKELRCLVGTPACVFNILVSDLILLGAAVLLAFCAPRDLYGFFPAGIDFAGLEGLPLPESPHDMIQLVVPWGFALLSLSVPFAACATSLEGRASWVMATAPHVPCVILGSKLLVSMMHLVLVALVSALLLVFAGQLEPLVAVECVLVSLGYSSLMGAAGMAVDIRSPNFAWSAPAEVVKRGAPITAGVLVGAAAMMLSGLVSGGSLLLAGPVAAHAANVAASVLMAAMGAGIFSRVGSRPLWL